MKKIIVALAIATLAITQSAQAVVVAPVVVATTASIAAASSSNQHKKAERRHAREQAETVLQVAQMGGLTVDANSGHVIIRCRWKEGGNCIIPGGEKAEGFFSANKDLVITPQQFAERHGYKKVHRITLLPLYEHDWLALDVSKE